MAFEFEEFVKAIGAVWTGSPDTPSEIREASTDTRTLGPGDAFFALRGQRFDGHAFLKEAFLKGASVAVVAKDAALSEDLPRGARLLAVEDTLKAYGDLAAAYRAKHRIPAVAITGSSGKTTVKELVAHLLGHKFRVLKNRGTENNLVGVPKTLLQINAEHELVVLEMGTNRPGEIERLASIIQPQVGVITLIGLAHLEGFGSQEGIRQEKLKLVPEIERGGILILNGEDPLLAPVTSGVHKTLRCGWASDRNDYWADQVWCHDAGSSFSLNGGELIETQLLGRHNVQNCLYAIAVARAFGLELPVIRKALATFKPVMGRLVTKTIGGITFLDDTYNSNPSSFRAALETLKDFKVRGRKGIVCGDMLELGECMKEEHRRLGRFIAESLFDFVIAVGPCMRHLADEVLAAGLHASRVHRAKDSAEAGALLKTIAAAGDVILVKGSRGMKMETIFECYTTSSTP